MEAMMEGRKPGTIGRRLISLILLIASLFAAPSMQAAQNDPPGVDIVFVVDQSGSMSKGSIKNANDPACKPVITDRCPRTPATDPSNLALKSLPAGLNPIFAQMLVRAEGREKLEFKKEKHQFGLVLFGGSGDQDEPSAKTHLDLTTIEIVKDSDGNLVSNIQANKLLPTKVENMGDTAFSAAFSEACRVLQCNTPPLPGRKRIVVLLTDGRPARDPYLGEFNQNKPEIYFDALARQHSNLLSTSRLYVIGLDTGNQFWSLVEPQWKKLAEPTGGRAVLITDPKQISAEFTRIAGEVIDSDVGTMRPCDSTFTVVPYKESLRLILQYPDEETRAEFTLPDGSTLKANPPQIVRLLSTQNEIFVVTNPPAGTWTCKVTGGSVKPQFRDIQEAISLSQVSLARPGGTGSTCHEFMFTVSYKDKNGDLIREDPNYPLVQKAGITIDTQVITRDLVLDSPEHDRWRLDGMLKPGASGGTYPVVIDVRLPDGTPIFRDTSQHVAIDPKLPCMHIVAPADGGKSEVYNMLTPSNVEVAVQLTQGGKPGEVSGVFREDLSQIILARVEGPDNLKRDVELSPVKGSPGKYAAKVPGLQQLGKYTFSASIKGTTQAGSSYELTPQSVSFERIPSPSHNALMFALRILTSLVLVALTALAGIFLFMITPPYPRGTLLFQQRATGSAAQHHDWETIKSLSLNRQRTFLGLFRTRWPTIRSKNLPKSLGIKRLKVRRLISGKNEGVEVKGVRTNKKGNFAWQFTRDQQQRALDGDTRIVYENYSAGNKRS